MYEYPIYKNLTQFSNLVDDKGELKQTSQNVNLASNTPAGSSMEKKGEKKDDDESADKKEDGADGAQDKNSQSKEGGNQQNGSEAGTTLYFADKKRWKRNYDNLGDKDRQEMLVDEIFALYLYRMSNRINQGYYTTVLAYVIFFRECLNEYGWGKKIESEQIVLENNPDLKNDIESKLFCLVNNAEHAPEICNEFVTVYMEYKKSIYEIPKHDQIDLTINLCHWLFEC